MLAVLTYPQQGCRYVGNTVIKIAKCCPKIMMPSFLVQKDWNQLWWINEGYLRLEITKNQTIFNSLMQFNEVSLLQKVKMTTYFPNKIVQKRPLCSTARAILRTVYKSELAYYGQNFQILSLKLWAIFTLEKIKILFNVPIQ